MEATEADSDLYRWQVHSVKTRTKLDIPADYTAWTNQASLLGVTKRDRCMDLLNTAWAAALQEFQMNAKKAARKADHGHGGKGSKRKLPSTFDDTTVPPANEEKVAKDLYVHLDQAVQRRPWKRNGVGCLTQRSEIYSYGADCILPPIIHCRLQGFPDWYSWDFAQSDTQRRAYQRSLAGESFSYQVAAIALYAAFLTERAPWLHPELWPEVESDSD